MEGRDINRSVPLWLVVVITVFAFFGGAMGGVLFCAHYARDPLGPASGVVVEQADTEQFSQPGTTERR